MPGVRRFQINMVSFLTTEGKVWDVHATTRSCYWLSHTTAKQLRVLTVYCTLNSPFCILLTETFTGAVPMFSETTALREISSQPFNIISIVNKDRDKPSAPRKECTSYMRISLASKTT